MYNTSDIVLPHTPSVNSILITGDSSHNASWSSLVGIVTAIIGNILISFALNTQRYAHVRIDREYNQEREDEDTRAQLRKSIRNYGSTKQQENVAEERARLNAEAPGPGNTTDENTNAFGQPQRKTSFSSEETAKPHERGSDAEHGRKSYLKSPIWWVGIVLMTIGEAGNFLAYGFAPASIVSPLGVVALISNCLIAPLMLKERFRQRDFWGVLIAIGGAVTVVFSAKTSEVRMGPDDLWHAIKRWEFLTYIGITCAFIVALMVASPRYGKRTIVIDLGLVGLFGGYTALSTKGVASMLSGSLWKALTFPITYPLIVVLISSAIMQIRYLNRALSNFNSTQVIPTQFVLFTLSVIIGSAVLYRDFEKTDLDHVIKFIVGCALTFSGVWLITSGRKNPNSHDENATHDETIHLIDEEAEQAADDETPQKYERPAKSDLNLDTSPSITRRLTSDSSNKATASPSVPSVLFTPYDENEYPNPWTSSAEQIDDIGRPRTPPNPRHLDIEGTPFFTPTSAPTTATKGRVSLINRTDSSPADPQTPTKNSRAPSPPKPDMSVVAEVAQTPHANLLRSARGSMSRFLPGPFLGPLSSSSLNVVVAESLLKGEGSPQGPVRSRSYAKRTRPSQTSRSERRQSATATSGAEGLDLESGLPTPAISRWQTRETAPASGRSRGNTLDSQDGSDDPNNPSSSKQGLLPSLSPTFSKLMSRMKDRGKDPAQDESGEESSGRAG